MKPSRWLPLLLAALFFVLSASLFSVPVVWIVGALLPIFVLGGIPICAWIYLSGLSHSSEEWKDLVLVDHPRSRPPYRTPVAAQGFPKGRLSLSEILELPSPQNAQKDSTP